MGAVGRVSVREVAFVCQLSRGDEFVEGFIVAPERPRLGKGRTDETGDNVLCAWRNAAAVDDDVTETIVGKARLVDFAVLASGNEAICLEASGRWINCLAKIWRRKFADMLIYMPLLF